MRLSRTVALLLACVGFARAADPPVVARVGQGGLITERDLSDFSAAESCYGPDALSSRQAGFMRLLETELMAEVLRREAGVEFSEEDYAKELKRVDESTRAPDILACIKRHFGWSPEAGWPDAAGRGRYERVFLRKNIVAPPFHRFVSFDRKVQAEAYGRGEALLARARRGEPFARLAEDEGVEYSTKTYRLTEPEGADAGPGRWSPFEASFIEEHLKALKPGEVKPELIDASDLRLVKLLAAGADGSYSFELIRIRKQSVPDYLARIPKLSCRIEDAGLKSWTEGIRGNPVLGVCAF